MTSSWKLWHHHVWNLCTSQTMLHFLWSYTMWVLHFSPHYLPWVVSNNGQTSCYEKSFYYIYKVKLILKINWVRDIVITHDFSFSNKVRCLWQNCSSFCWFGLGFLLFFIMIFYFIALMIRVLFVNPMFFCKPKFLGWLFCKFLLVNFFNVLLKIHHNLMVFFKSPS